MKFLQLSFAQRKINIADDICGDYDDQVDPSTESEQNVDWQLNSTKFSEQKRAGMFTPPQKREVSILPPLIQ